MQQEPYGEEDLEYGPAISFELAKDSQDFATKAKKILSNTMDLVNHHLESGMADAAIIKTGLEIGKMFKVGIETVDEAAERAFREASQYESVEEEDTGESTGFAGYGGMSFTFEEDE